MDHHLVFRAGVTGKRELDPNLVDWVRTQIRFILGSVKTATEDVLTKSLGAYQGTSAALRAISPLAEGADRIFAEQALDLGYELNAPLPFERREYCKDFPLTVPHFEQLLQRATAVFEMDGTRSGGEHPYEAVGRLLLDQSDILIAVWDGLPAQGRGGTEHIMEIALGRRMPVFCVRLDLQEIVLLSPGDLHGRDPLTVQKISAAVESLTLPPWLRLPEPGHPDATGAYTASTPEGDTILGRCWLLLRTALCVRGNLPEQIEEVKIEERRYVEVNECAMRLAGLYRGTFVVNYTLGTLAVFFALLSYADDHRVYYWLTCELLSIAAVVLLIDRLREHRWHYRTVDCRYLAEQLRILHFVQPLGLAPPLPRLPAHHMHSPIEQSWMEWRLRAIVRETPMPSGTFAADQLEPILKTWIPSQINYHELNHARNHLIEERLHFLAKLFVAIAGSACVAHFFLHDPDTGRWLTFLAAGFPAAAGACHAISTQGEFRRLAERSRAMTVALQHVTDRFDRLLNGILTGVAARREVSQLAHLMLEEVLDWQILYRKDVPPA